jgi:hypothetical protein
MLYIFSFVSGKSVNQRVTSNAWTSWGYIIIVKVSRHFSLHKIHLILVEIVNFEKLYNTTECQNLTLWELGRDFCII